MNLWGKYVFSVETKTTKYDGGFQNLLLKTVLFHMSDQIEIKYCHIWALITRVIQSKCVMAQIYKFLHTSDVLYGMPVRTFFYISTTINTIIL